MEIPSEACFAAGLFQPGEIALLEDFEIFRLRGEDCPYFDDARPRESLNFICRDIEPLRYEALLAYGWRRCGCLFYKSVCQGCPDCHPLRVDAARFKPDRSQRRCALSNEAMDIAVGDPGDLDEDFELFRRYCASRHGELKQSREEFRLFLATPPLPSLAIRHRDASGRLLCVAWTDVLPDSLSAVYTAFDPGLPKLGLGVFSILTQIELCKRTDRRHLQMGFHIPCCRKMSYKSLYKPCETPGRDGVWRPLA